MRAHKDLKPVAGFEQGPTLETLQLLISPGGHAICYNACKSSCRSYLGPWLMNYKPMCYARSADASRKRCT